MRFDKRFPLLVAALGMFGVGTTFPAKAEIIVTDWTLRLSAADTPSSGNETQHDSVTLPFEEVHTVMAGGTSVESAYAFTLGDNSATFNIDTLLARSENESAALSWGRIRFWTTEPVAYAISGGLQMAGTGTLDLSAHLGEAAYPNPYLYAADHFSRSTPNESFTLGNPGGDFGWYELGQLSGTLTPYVGYEFYYYSYLGNYPVTDTAATAYGNMSLVLSPEPSTLLFLVLGGSLLMRKQR